MAIRGKGFGLMGEEAKRKEVLMEEKVDGKIEGNSKKQSDDVKKPKI